MCSAEHLAVRQLLAEPSELRVHLERDEQRALGIVLVADRRAEEREHRVTRVLVDRSLVAPDDLAERGDQRVDHLDELLRIERSEAA